MNFSFNDVPVRGAVAVMTAMAVFSVDPQTAPAAASTGQVMFSYQGRVKVGGEPHNGQGQFKFAIVNTEGNVTLWSHDGTSALGGEPSASINLDVSDGVFNVMMGDPQVGMLPINPTVFQSQTPIRLRVWFSDGVNGFQQLNPDHKLTNLTLTTLETGDEDFTIYVDGATGNDANNGLTPQTAKKTIQAAVDTLPDRIKCNVTIDIADGVYPESVRIYGMAVEPGKKLRFVGDESWTAASSGSPSVQVTGQDSGDTAAPKVRKNGFSIVQSSGLEMKGIEVEGFSEAGINAEAALMKIEGCRLINSLEGIFGVASSNIEFVSTKADSNLHNGIYVGRQSSAVVTGCIMSNNGQAGLRSNAFTTVRFIGPTSTTSNNSTGLIAQHNSSIVFTSPVTISNNVSYCMQINLHSYTENDAIAIISGNGNFNNPYLAQGSDRYNY